MKFRNLLFGALLLPLLSVGTSRRAAAQMITGVGDGIGITQKPGSRVPLDVRFTDSTGQAVTLRRYFSKKPVVMMMIYYKCPGICALEFGSMVAMLSKLKQTVGDNFDMLTVSIDPSETPALAAAKKQAVMKQYGRPAAASSWHFLVGPQASLQALATAVGYKYTYDAKTDRIVHPAVAMVLTADGRVSQYLFGVDYPTLVFKNAVTVASASRLAPPDPAPILLGCCVYNPKTGKYELVVDRALKVGGIGTVLLLGLSILVMTVRSRGSHEHESADGEAPAEPPAS